jgi:HrpA-like RNA helicase
VRAACLGPHRLTDLTDPESRLLITQPREAAQVAAVDAARRAALGM